MKQNGVRLVQRKFAQGVPIPVSSVSVAPAPPERRPDPPYTPKNVYHNNMSARNLLDIVSMQNIHKHKPEPLVVLERIRDDEIPSPTAPSGRCVRPRSRVAMRRRTLKGNKGNMCLRSGAKRSAAAAGKAPVKKRKKQSSESTDDIPLVYYFNNKPKEIKDKKEKKEKLKLTPTPKKMATRARSDGCVNKPALRADLTAADEGSFTFKEPSGPVRLSYRLHKKKTPVTARHSRGPRAGRGPSLRSRRAPAPPRPPRGIVRRLRNAVLLGKKAPNPDVRKACPKQTRDDAPPPPGPPASRVPRPPPSESTSNEMEAYSETSSMVDVEALTKVSPVPSIAHSTCGEVDWCIPPVGLGPGEHCEHSPMSAAESVMADIVRRLPTPEPTVNPVVKLEQVTLPSAFKMKYDNLFQVLSVSDSEDSSIQTIKDTNKNKAEKDEYSEKTKQKHEGDKEDEIAGRKCEKNKEDEIAGQKYEKNKEDKKAGQKHEKNKDDDKTAEKNERGEENKKVGQKDQSEKVDMEAEENNKADKVDKKARENNEMAKEDVSKPEDKTKRIKGKGVGKKTVQKETRGSKPKAAPVKEKKTLPKRAAKAAPAQEEASSSASTRQLRNSREPPPANPDVYEFDELEASRPPSGLRRRPQPSPEPAARSPDGIQYVDLFPECTKVIKVDTKKKEENLNVVSASLVLKEDVIYQKRKILIDNLTSSPALLHKFFSSLTTELQDELGSPGKPGTPGTPGKPGTPGTPAAAGGAREDVLGGASGSVFEAPTYYPTPEEFEDPIKYFDKIAPEASKYGLCKIVPPASFKPTCTMRDNIRFAVIYQYISKMYSRWGPVSRELAAIKAHLRTQSVVFARSPLLDGSEVNLPRLYHAVERNGGLSNVIRRKRWGRVADEMKLAKLQHPERKLDPIYMRYLLPYAALSDQERQNIMADVEKCWTLKYQKMLERARNPFLRQQRMLGTECESESDEEGEDGNTAGALHEAEDCIVQGRIMNLVTFKKIATSLMDAHFDPAKQPPTAFDVERAYWRAVLLGTDHIVANTASIDTGEEGYGFPKDPQAEYGSHPWNLKVLARNPNNVLRYLGPVLGVTVPTLHLSMLFSTSCWHRDPHGLPWVEYMHGGADKIWYGIPRDESANFRRAVETLCPAYCQNKSIWLASEIAMVPPSILREHGVRLARLQQRPGEYVLVFPEAHSCSVATGRGISESVYFASNTWLTDVYKLFQELRNSCEPTMFSLEQLLLNGSADSSAPPQVCSVLATLLTAELRHRRALEHKGLQVVLLAASPAPPHASRARPQDECEYCRSPLFLSKVTGLTGRQAAVCAEHALRLLESRRHKRADIGALQLLSSFPTRALQHMLQRLDSRAAEHSAQEEHR